MKRLIPTLLVLVMVLATGCAKLTHDPIDKHYFQITPHRTAPAAQVDGPVLKVRRLSVSDLYNTRELIYRESENQIESDYYNMFFVSPGNMLTTELRTWLRDSGLFSHVIEPGSMVVSGLTLEGVVNALYGDYTGNSPAAVVEMQFFVVDESTSQNVIVFSGDYVQRVPMAQAAPADLVKAMTQGVQTIFTNLESDLATAPLKE